MTPRPAAAALALLAAAGCSVGQPPDSPRSEVAPGSSLTSSRCADLIVLGARGSTQSFTKNYGAGTEVRASVTAMASRLQDRSDTSVRLAGVPYPANPGTDYAANVSTGVDNLDTLFTQLAEDCPRSRFAMVGFSQGAQIVHGFAVQMSGQIDRVDLVAMISDPRHNPDDAMAHYAYGNSATSGNGKLGAGTPLPSRLRSKAVTFCVEEDEVCNWPSQGYTGPLSDTHRHFYETAERAQQTGEQLDKILRANS